MVVARDFIMSHGNFTFSRRIGFLWCLLTGLGKHIGIMKVTERCVDIDNSEYMRLYLECPNCGWQSVGIEIRARLDDNKTSCHK